MPKFLFVSSYLCAYCYPTVLPGPARRTRAYPGQRAVSLVLAGGGTLRFGAIVSCPALNCGVCRPEQVKGVGVCMPMLSSSSRLVVDVKIVVTDCVKIREGGRGGAAH